MTSRLTVGVERLDAKPPRGQPPCTEPVTYGTNVLIDPGFELQLANFGGGPDGNEIPMIDSGSGVWLPLLWSDHSAGPARSDWSQDWLDVSWAYDRWRISTANPRSGTYHARLGIDSFLGFGHDKILYSTQAYVCETGDLHSAFCQPGDFLLFSVYASATDVSQSPNFQMELDVYDAAGSVLAGPSVTHALTTSYALVSVSLFAPAGAHSVSGYFYVDNTGDGVGYFIDVADCVLQVSK